MLELTNRGQITENKNAFSQNTIWSAIDNLTYSLDEDIIFASFFISFEDLYATDCVNWADFMEVSPQFQKLAITK